MAETQATAAPAPESDGSVRGGKVLVTGGTGFVGGYVVRELLARGYQPVCLTRDPERVGRKLPPELRGRVQAVRGDILDWDALTRATTGCSAVIHLVGIIEEKPVRGQTFERMHTMATAAVVDACEAVGVRRYLHMSALGTRPDAVSRYHQTKWEAEEIVRGSELDWTIFRPSLIHGPDGEFMRMMKFFCTSRVRQPVMPYFGSGNALIQPISVRDVATIFVRALALPGTIRQVYELGGPQRYTWKELYDICALAIAGRTRRKVSVPVPLAKLAARTIVPLLPRVIAPYKFNVAQVQMSQEDSICNAGQIEEVFGLRLRDLRDELTHYAELIE